MEIVIIWKLKMLKNELLKKISSFLFFENFVFYFFCIDIKKAKQEMYVQEMTLELDEPSRTSNGHQDDQPTVRDIRVCTEYHDSTFEHTDSRNVHRIGRSCGHILQSC